jgi:membrane protease YdiL (CAAX protease family)
LTHIPFAQVMAGMDSSQVLFALLLGGALLLLMGGILAFFMGLNRLTAPRGAPAPLVESGEPAEVSEAAARREPQGLGVGWIVGLSVLLPLLGLVVPRILQAVYAGRQGGPSVWDSVSQTLAGWNRTGAALQAICLAVLVYETLWRGKRIDRDLLRRRHFTFWTVTTGLITGVGLWVVSMFAQRVISALLGGGWERWFTPLRVDHPAYSWLAMLVAVLVTPLVEELFFRGYVQPRWSQRLGPGWGLAATALLAALFSLNLLTLLPLFIVHLALGYLAWRWGNLAPSWLAHAVYNLLLVLAGGSV